MGNANHIADVSKMIQEHFQRAINTALGLPPPQPQDTEAGNLTLDKLRQAEQALEDAKPIRWYADAPEVERGKVIILSKTEYYDEYWLLHPDDVDDMRRKLVGYRLVHLRDKPKEQPKMTLTPQGFVSLFKASPEYIEIFNQVNACNTRHMLAMFGETLLTSYVLAGRMMLTFERGDNKHITCVTADNDKSRLGLHACTMTVEMLKDVIVDVLGSEVYMQPDEGMQKATEIRIAWDEANET